MPRPIDTNVLQPRAWDVVKQMQRLLDPLLPIPKPPACLGPGSCPRRLRSTRWEPPRLVFSLADSPGQPPTASPGFFARYPRQSWLQPLWCEARVCDIVPPIAQQQHSE